MYQDSNMLASIRKVEAAREENAKLDPRRMTAEEKDTLLKKFHPDYRAEQFTDITQRQIGPVLIDQDIVAVRQILFLSVVFDAIIIADPGTDRSQRVLRISLNTQRKQKSRCGSE